MYAQKIRAGASFPSITVLDADGEPRDISRPANGHDWLLVVAYRGAHCPMCTRYLNEVEPLLGQLHELGVDVLAVSADDVEQVARHREQLNISFPLYHGLTVEQMETLGLYVSDPRPGETDHRFGEPAMFVIDPEGRIQIVDVSNNPFARPELSIIVKGIRWMQQENYPIRGQYLSSDVAAAST